MAITQQAINEMNRRFNGSIDHRLDGEGGIILIRGDKKAKVVPIKTFNNGNRFRFHAPGCPWTPRPTEKSCLRGAREALMKAVPAGRA